MRVGLIANALARHHRRDVTLVRRLSLALGAVVCRAPPSLRDIPAAASDLRTAGVDVVAISGGDGSVHHILSAVLAAYGGPPRAVVLLPSGTMNTVARDLGVRGAPLSVAQAVGSGRHRPVVRSPVSLGAGRVGFLVGTGFWARFLQEYDGAWGPGPLRAAGVLGRGLASTVVGGPFVRRLFAPVSAELTWNDEAPVVRAFTMVAVGAVHGVGLGFSPFSAVAERGVHGLAFVSRPGRVGRQLPRLYRGRAPVPPDRGGAVRSLRLRAEVPFQVAIDGEITDPVADLTLGVGPRVTFWVPDAGR